jgi:hypothetical protein
VIGTNPWMLYLYAVLIILSILIAGSHKDITNRIFVPGLFLLAAVAWIGSVNECFHETCYALNAFSTFFVVAILWLAVTFVLGVIAFYNRFLPLLHSTSGPVKGFICVVFYCIPMSFVVGAMMGHQIAPAFSLVPKPTNGRAAIVFYRPRPAGSSSNVDVLSIDAQGKANLIVSLPTKGIYYHEMNPGSFRLSAQASSGQASSEKTIAIQPNDIAVQLVDVDRGIASLIGAPSLIERDLRGMHWVDHNGKPIRLTKRRSSVEKDKGISP